MHELEDAASRLAAEVGCVACVLGDPNCGSGTAAAVPGGPEELAAYLERHPLPAAWWLGPAATRRERSGVGGHARTMPRAAQPALQLQTLNAQPQQHTVIRHARSGPGEQGGADAGSRDDAGYCAGSAEVADDARARLVGAVLGSLLADAAAMGVHWVYDLDLLSRLQEEAACGAADATQAQAQVEEAWAGGDSSRHSGATVVVAETAGLDDEETPGVGLEFLNPPRSPFYTYASGRNSP
jgi:hypothetical protein